MKRVGRPPSFETPEDLDKVIDAYKIECEEKDEPFTIIGLAVFAGVDKDTMVEYGKKEKFSVSYKRAMSYAESHLVKYALNGKYNPTVSIFLMKNNHGYKDKTEVEVSEQPKGFKIEDA